MNEEDQYYGFQAANNKNYYQQQLETHQGLKYRLDGDDVVERVVNQLRGVRKGVDGRKTQDVSFCMMNETGISRVESFLSSAVNKINHLTKYENEARVLLQLRAMIRTFIPELVINLKTWSPYAEYEDENKTFILPNGRAHVVNVRRLVNPMNLKVPNWRMIIQIIENAILQSMQRAQEGFEAKNVTQQHQISEVISRPPGGGNWMDKLLGRGGNV